MKLALFDDFVPGVVRGDRLVDVSAVVGEIMALPPHDRMPSIIAEFDRLRPALTEAARTEGVPLKSVRLRAPIPRPSKILCGLGNYMEGTDTPKRPLGLFLKAPSAVIDPGETVELPPAQATVFHHEAELAVVIGRRAKGVAAADAPAFIFGYTCFIDVSARGLGQGVGFIDKSFDTFAPLGPWVVTKDEIGDPQKLQVRLWVDGQPRHDYNTDDMEHSVVELVSWASRVATLEPGDILSCGTNHQGIGPMQDGETVEIEIEKIGRMAVQVRDPLKRSWPKGIDEEMARFVRERRRDPSTPLPKTLFPQR
ncbi:MAG: fumarylacetoacetate hydrolase family protein [Deltaproteobacteria bacterium]|nr:fumarylacetoacetate hydrolase family protein [Deltaproteobacteria bacterium]